MPAFDRQAEYFRNGGFAGAEAYAIHRRWMDRIAEYDPRVGQARGRSAKDIERRGTTSNCGLLRAVLHCRSRGRCMAPFDAFLMPTTPCIAPTIREVDASDEDYFRWNMPHPAQCRRGEFPRRLRRDAALPGPGEAPVGLSVCGPAMSDRHVLAVGAGGRRRPARVVPDPVASRARRARWPGGASSAPPRATRRPPGWSRRSAPACSSGWIT